MAEGATRGVLTGQADARAAHREGRQGKRLTGGPVERPLPCGHLAPVLESALDLRMYVEAGRDRRQRPQHRRELLAPHARRDGSAAPSGPPW
jgi:hypothetical protein